MGPELSKPMSFLAAAAIGQYRFCKFTTAGRLIQSAAAGDDVVAISLEDVSAAEVTAGTVVFAADVPGCKQWVTAGAAIDVSAAAVPVTSDATGRAVGVAAATDRIAGYAMTSATAADQFVLVLFVKGGDRRDA